MERHAGFIDGLTDFPDVRIVAERFGSYLKEEAEKQMSDILARLGNQFDLVFALNDPMALGVYNAVSKYGGKQPLIIGIDALPGEDGGIEYISEGIISASFIYPTGGDMVIELAMKILRGEPFIRENTLHTAVVNKSNVRVLQLQLEQIDQHQNKLSKMSAMLNRSLAQYSNQQTIFYGTILVLALITILLMVSWLAYRSKCRSNKRLEEQKDKLISLSKELEEATQAKLIFFTNISHEFRTPLTLISAPVETLLNSGGITGEQKALLSLVKRNSNRLLNLISEIIEFRTFENGKMEMRYMQSDIRQFIEELNISLFEHAVAKNVDFGFTAGDAASWEFSFDKGKVEKIYFNLLSNAFKHTAPGGRISVTAGNETVEGCDYFSLSVFNSGKAIPEDKIKSIFERFYKVNPHDPGAGIGLAFASALVDTHNGRISVVSKEGAGTTFTVLLPYDQMEVINPSDEIYEQGYIRSQLELESRSKMEEAGEKLFVENLLTEDKPIILLIEDNADMRGYMRTILKNDYTVIEAADGETGIDMSIRFIPDVIICDVMMPGKDGFGVCGFLKENVFTSHIPIIMLTACSLDEQKAEGFQSGADAYISKPFNVSLLKIRIQKLIENRRKIKQAHTKSFVNDSKKTTIAKIEQSFINKFRKYVEDNIMEPDLNVIDIAKQMGLSRSQLYRKIKSLVDYSPNELVRIIRLKYAAEKISQGIPISEIAYESGFSSASYFTKCFKEFYKVNPSEYLLKR
jgi:signal transduction histidine kinase/CheY-like chemotaxis protein/AraC-like DNA-binding protein